MKALLVWPNFEPTNAAGVRGRAFAAGLARAGVDVVVAAPPDPAARVDATGYRVETPPLLRELGDPWLAGRRALRALADRERPDLVLASSPSVLTLLQAEGALRGRAPFVADVRDLGAASLRASFGAKLRYRFLEAAEGRALRKADAILTVSAIQREDAVRDYRVDPRRAHVVPNGADLAAFRAHRGSTKDVDVLFAGHLRDPGRRGDEVVEAFAEVHKSRPATSFRFLGWARGGYADALETRMRERGLAEATDLRPHAPHDKMPAEVARARVGIVPLQDAPVYRAAVGAKTYEYLAAGVPVVALGPRGDTELRRLLEGERCGLYAEDAAGFARALLTVLDDDELRARLSLRAAAVAESYDRARIVEAAWRDVLRPLAEGSR